ncbi:hypothetical protein OGAPHI_007101 [Ogataea philodendri]|uniref:RRM domain-containing protein n=1 Tax=Ogataea philodendri TaxID=1378263 RepID=A0A9P8T048_9ASCO|nr:uncharacterized protein OGAPHI_007101 [Ogataea philodendri]KAH3660515.1 hypothetical protein OGAPHI_007101 [Ogataea philodendri]
MSKRTGTSPERPAKRARTSKIRPGYTVYIKNINDKLPATKLKRNLYILFSSVGDVIAINCPNRGKYRGQAWVAMSSLEESKAAIADFNGFAFFGKPLAVEYSDQKSHTIEKLERQSETPGYT